MRAKGLLDFHTVITTLGLHVFGLPQIFNLEAVKISETDHIWEVTFIFHFNHTITLFSE